MPRPAGWPVAARRRGPRSAPPGSARPRCWTTARSLPAEAGCLVRRAAPRARSSATSRSAWCARCSRRPCATRRSPSARSLLDGAAAAAGELLLDGTAPGADATMLIAHSVLWLCSALAERPAARAGRRRRAVGRPLVARGAVLPRAAGRRPAAADPGRRARRRPGRGADLLSLLGAVRSATVLHPRPLTPRGAARLIRRHAPDTPADVCRDCHRAVGGNPWLLGELGRQIAAHGPEALDEPDHDAPPVTAIARSVVRRRLAELSPRDRGVVEALAVIGDAARAARRRRGRRRPGRRARPGARRAGRRRACSTRRRALRARR